MKLRVMAASATLLAGTLSVGSAVADEPQGKQLFEMHCSVCHGLDIPRTQRLNLNDWRWVVRDMVNDYGASWITEEQQELITQYLAEAYGPNTPR
ncbi:hypothetical protein HUS23_04735 [Ectothiorhodospiraceae bacterium 2226]|nr:hypothetical protein HUS23_04735 [Ectothiorhodospiraceae bacterium 2226]